MKTGIYTPEEFGLEKTGPNEYVDKRGQKHVFKCAEHVIRFFEPQDVHAEGGRLPTSRTFGEN